MNNKQENQLSMFLILLAFYRKNQTVWEDIPRVVQVVEGLQTKTDQIQAAHKAYVDTVSTGHTKKKAQIRQQLEDNLLFFIPLLTLIGEEEDNTVLLSKINYNRTSLRRERDTELASVARCIINYVNARMQLLQDEFKIPREQFTLLHESVDEYQSVFAKPISTYNDRISSRRTISTQISETYEFVKNKVGKTMSIFKLTAPQFYQEYELARKVSKT